VQQLTDDATPDAIGITLNGSIHTGPGESVGTGFVLFTKGPDAGFHGITTSSKGFGLEMGLGLNFFAGYYNGDSKNMKSDFGGTGYQGGGKFMLGTTMWGSQKPDGSLGWGGVSLGIGPSYGGSIDKTHTEYNSEK
jgi:hypothetical protein